MAKIISVRVPKGQALQLTQEAMEALGDVDEVHITVDPESRMVTIQAEHPFAAHNAAIMDEIAELSDGGSWFDGLGEPVPESSEFRRAGKRKDGDS